MHMMDMGAYKFQMRLLLLVLFFIIAIIIIAVVIITNDVYLTRDNSITNALECQLNIQLIPLDVNVACFGFSYHFQNGMLDSLYSSFKWCDF